MASAYPNIVAHFALRSLTELDDETHLSLYWSNTDGWVDLIDATIFNEDELTKINPPTNAIAVGIAVIDIDEERKMKKAKKMKKSSSRDPKSEHYDRGGIEALDVIEAKLTSEQYEGYLMGNAIKYLLRLNWKGTPDRDAEKAAYYAKWLKELHFGGESGKSKEEESKDIKS